MEKKQSKLSPPMFFNGDNIEEIIKLGFDHFYKIFLKKEVKPLYRGKKIFFDMNSDYSIIDLGMPERFLHTISIEDKEEYSIYPCNNDLSFMYCESKCLPSNALLNFSVLNRIQCIYRLSRVHWIPEIIILAQDNDEDVYVWEEVKKDNRGNKKNHHYIRYFCGIDDYIIVLEDRTRDKKGDYMFITAYPVFTKNQKLQCDSAYKKYSKK